VPVLGSVRCASDSQACVQGINSLYKQETLVLAGSSCTGRGNVLARLTGSQVAVDRNAEYQ
jgi:hypothetical protein